MNKKGFEFNFGWMFAIIVGAAIIFLAVYGVSKLGSTERGVQNTEVAQQLGNILTPMETSMEEGKTAPIHFPLNSRVYIGCRAPYAGNVFGAQTLGVSTESSIGNKWENSGVNYSVYNKYLFGRGMLEGKDFIIFSKPFELPFKIADVMIILRKEGDYCFISSPDSIESELRDLGLNGTIQFAENKNQCGKRLTVCFGSTSCDINVFIDDSGNGGSVRRGSKTVYYEGNLLYPALFSDPVMYECQFGRMMMRASELSKVYLSKSDLLAARGEGCSATMQPYLMDFATETQTNNSISLVSIVRTAEDIKEVNRDATSCRLF